MHCLLVQQLRIDFPRDNEPFPLSSETGSLLALVIFMFKEVNDNVHRAFMNENEKSTAHFQFLLNILYI
jgi:undecaprenyl pyrophosphate phosphatase UppP